MKLLDLNKYLVARFMFQHAIDGFTSLFQKKNNEYHNHETVTTDYFYIPAVTMNLGKTGIRFRGAIIWNAVYRNDINIDVAEAVYVKLLKRLINENLLLWTDGRAVTQSCILSTITVN